MAMEIIDVKYRDMFGINPKYERIIDSRLNDADCFHAFQVLVNTALENLTKLIEGKTRTDLIEPKMFGKYYGYNDNDDGSGGGGSGYVNLSIMYNTSGANGKNNGNGYAIITALDIFGSHKNSNFYKDSYYQEYFDFNKLIEGD